MKKAFYLFLIVMFCFTITGCTKQNKVQKQKTQTKQNQNTTFPESGNRSGGENNEIGQKLNQNDTEDIDKIISDIDNIDKEIDSDEDLKEVDNIEE